MIRVISKKYLTGLLIIGFVLSFCFACETENQVSTKSIIAVDTPIISSSKELYLPPRQDYRIAVISDLNSQYGSTKYEPEVDQAISLMDQWQPDLVLCGGDMIAGQKATLSKAQIEAMWAAFERHIALPLRQKNIPFGFTIGNHDGSGAVKSTKKKNTENQSFIFEQERELAQAYWNQEQHQLGLNFANRANFPFYYSFKQNDIFFLVWDASSQNISQAQLAWVKQQLASPSAQQAAMRIALGHLPLYPVAQAKNKPGEYLANGSQLRSLLTKNQVAVYISGHHHAYYPGKKDSLNLLHAGALGQGERQLINSESTPQKTVTVVDLKLEPANAVSKRTYITYTTYDAATWELIPIKRLPESISGEYGTIFRADLVTKP